MTDRQPRERFRVAKTIKLFIAGEFPRTESGRTIPVHVHGTETVYSQICRASRKDLRNAVTAAAAAVHSWESKTTYNRAQILYRMAEMAEGKREEFVDMLTTTLGFEDERAETAVDEMVDAFVYYAGWADKYQQAASSVNPVSGPQHCLTKMEPIGVVGALTADDLPLASFVANIAAILASGNTVIALVPSQIASLLAPLSETMATSDLPKGVVNFLTGDFAELLPHFASHMEIQALSLLRPGDDKTLAILKTGAADNMKRVVSHNRDLSLEHVVSFTEAKTIWHPIGY